VYLRWFIERLAKALDIPPSQWHPLVERLQPRVDLSSIYVKKADYPQGWRWTHSFALVVFVLLILGGVLWFGVEKVQVPPKKLIAVAPQKEEPLKARKPVALEHAERRIAAEASDFLAMTKPKTKEAEAALVRVHHLELRAKDLCWVRMKLENGGIRDFILKPTQRYEVPFTRAVEMKLGNPGAMEILVDGKALSLEGNMGRPKVLRVTPSGVEELPKGKALF